MISKSGLFTKFIGALISSRDDKKKRKDLATSKSNLKIPSIMNKSQIQKIKSDMPKLMYSKTLQSQYRPHFEELTNLTARINQNALFGLKLACITLLLSFSAF